MTDSYLQQLVIQRCKELGAPENCSSAAEFFSVGPPLIKQWINGSKTPSLSAVEKVFVMPPEKPAEAGWDSKEVFIAMPVYRSINPLTMLSLLAVWDRAKFGFYPRYGDAFIAHTRNRLADDFKSSGMQWCWWLDDDVIPPFGNAALFNRYTGMNLSPQFAGVHAPTKLRSRGVSCIGGLYFGRHAKGRAMYLEALSNPDENRRAHEPRDDFKPTSLVATGCLMHSRQVLLDIEKNFPHLAPQANGEVWHYFSNVSDRLVKFFGVLENSVNEVSSELRRGNAQRAGELVAELGAAASSAQKENFNFSRHHQGEDFTFCKRALASGHQPYVDFSVICGHADGATVWGPHNTKVDP